MEAAVVNVLSPGETALVASIGSFGHRFAAICKAFGIKVDLLDYPWGGVVDPPGYRPAAGGRQKT